MRESAKMVIMSHLSDAQGLLSVLNEYPDTIRSINREINFAKYIICMKGADSLMKEIDVDKMYKEFCEIFPENNAVDPGQKTSL